MDITIGMSVICKLEVWKFAYDWNGLEFI